MNDSDGRLFQFDFYYNPHNQRHQHHPQSPPSLHPSSLSPSSATTALNNISNPPYLLTLCISFKNHDHEHHHSSSVFSLPNYDQLTISSSSQIRSPVSLCVTLDCRCHLTTVGPPRPLLSYSSTRSHFVSFYLSRSLSLRFSITNHHGRCFYTKKSMEHLITKYLKRTNEPHANRFCTKK